MKQYFHFSMSRVSVKTDWMKVYVIQGKNGIMINVIASVENQMIRALLEMIIGGTLVRAVVS